MLYPAERCLCLGTMAKRRSVSTKFYNMDYIVNFFLNIDCKHLSSFSFVYTLVFNPIQTGLFWPSLDWGGRGGVKSPLHFLKTM